MDSKLCNCNTSFMFPFLARIKLHYMIINVNLFYENQTLSVIFVMQYFSWYSTILIKNNNMNFFIGGDFHRDICFPYQVSNLL